MIVCVWGGGGTCLSCLCVRESVWWLCLCVRARESVCVCAFVACVCVCAGLSGGLMQLGYAAARSGSIPLPPNGIPDRYTIGNITQAYLEHLASTVVAAGVPRDV